MAYHNDVRNFLHFIFCHTGAPADLSNLNTLSLRDCRAWLASRYNDFDKRSNARAVAAVKNFWRHLLKHKHIGSEVFFLLTAPNVKKTLPRSLTSEQTHILMENIDLIPDEPWVGLRNKALIILLYGTGLRISEALSLKQSQVTADVLIIKGKGSKERQVPLMKEVSTHLDAYLRECPYHGSQLPLFLGVRGKCLQASAAALILRTFRRMYNLPETLTPHALRHTCASHLMNASGDLRGIQALLGHESLSSTQVYTDLDTVKLLEIYKKTHPRK